MVISKVVLPCKDHRPGKVSHTKSKPISTNISRKQRTSPFPLRSTSRKRRNIELTIKQGIPTRTPHLLHQTDSQLSTLSFPGLNNQDLSLLSPVLPPAGARSSSTGSWRRVTPLVLCGLRPGERGVVRERVGDKGAGVGRAWNRPGT